MQRGKRFLIVNERVDEYEYRENVHWKIQTFEHIYYLKRKISMELAFVQMFWLFKEIKNKRLKRNEVKMYVFISSHFNVSGMVPFELVIISQMNVRESS